MSEDEDFQTNNEATEYVKHRLQAIREDEETKSKLMNTAFLEKLSNEDRYFIEKCANDMRNNINNVDKYKMYNSELIGYLLALVNFRRITKEEAILFNRNITCE